VGALKRRLAAILAADVVGYSKMMGADETATLAALNHLRHDIFEPLVADHQGTVVKRMGDGWLIEFDSALDAVNCAIAVQQSLTSHETIKMRIGIHIGDIIHDEEGDIHGDGVNIAARLEAVATPCRVSISDQVYQSLDGTIAPLFADGGEPELKNIARRIRVWNWPSTADTTDGAQPPVSNKVPVILLENFSQGGDADSANDVAMELQSGLLDALSNRSGVRVATELEKGVVPSYILKGRCRVSGTRCRLHASITVNASGETCWTTKIDGDISDIFDFVDSVVGQISAAIRVEINASAGSDFVSRPDSSLNVQQLLSKAAFYMHHFDEKNAWLSRDTMATAVALAGEDPMVLAMHAYSLMQTVPLAIERVEDIDVDAAMSFADRSVYFGPNVDFAFHNRARMRLWLGNDHDGCRKDAARALSINPGYHLAHEDLALADIFDGNMARGLVDLEAVMRQVPEQPITPYRLSILGIGHALLGNRETALGYALDGYERKPLVRLHALAYAAAASDNTEITSSASFRTMVDQHGLTSGDASRLPFARAEDKTQLESMLRRAGLPK